MPIRGDMGALKKLADRIREVSSAGFRQELGQVLGAAAVKLVADGFRQERDPYGRPWEPLKYRKGKILRKTGRMANAVAVEPRPNGFKLSIATVYAPVHQYGGTVKPHHRAAGSVLKNRRGRFISSATAARLATRAADSAHDRWAKQMERYEDGLRKTKPKLSRASVTSTTVARRAYQHGGGVIPQRQMVPTGDLGSIWAIAFATEAASLLRRRLRTAA